MARPLVDRRRDARFGLPEIAGAQAILRPGYTVSLVDLSAGGALIQGPRPLRPGARVHLQLTVGTRRLALSAHVLRCSVAALDTRQGVQYRGAVQFDHRCESLWESGTLDGYLVPGDDRPLTQPGGHGLPGPHRTTSDANDRDRK
ncbi:MAG TPA: PilZ domain-containing protein [Vicinamibacterales bacterium]|nr:PilZ domain-containing protein [Vicinamibacterales bacterium]